MRKHAVLALVAGLSLSFIAEPVFARGHGGGHSHGSSHSRSSGAHAKSSSKSHSVTHTRVSTRKAPSSSHAGVTHYNVNIKAPVVKDVKPVRDMSVASKSAPDTYVAQPQTPQKSPAANALTPEQIAQLKAEELARKQAEELAKSRAI